MKTIKLNYGEFAEKFKPVLRPNTKDTDRADIYGTTPAEIALFEAKRKELGYDYYHVWTVVENDGILYLTEGYHYVNRFAYILTENHWSSGAYYDICYSY
jgi:hypothetical protein